jgi:GntR family transcriptional regulator
MKVTLPRLLACYFLLITFLEKAIKLYLGGIDSLPKFCIIADNWYVPISQRDIPFLEWSGPYVNGVVHMLSLAGSCDRTSSVPLYQQIHDIILKAIQAGDLGAGEILPTERMLKEIYGVSRQTVRQALTALEESGYIERNQGSGTRVTHRSPQVLTNAITSMSEDMTARGLSAESITLTVELVIPSEDIARALHLQPGERTWCVRRLRLGDGSPLALNDLYLPADLPFSARDLSRMQSYYELIKKRFDLQPLTASDSLRAQLATDEQAGLLQIAPGSMLIVLERTAYTADQMPIEFTHIYFVPERFEYRIHLSGG